MAINMGKATAFLELDTSKFTKGFVSAQRDLKVFLDKSATAGQKLKGLSSAMGTTGTTLTKTVTLPLAAVGGVAIKTAADFEAGMSEVKAISGATGKDFKDLETKAMEMGAKTKFSASQSAEAFKYMAMAGWKTQDMLDGIEGVMDAAASSGEDLALVSDIVTDSLTAFGLGAKDTTRFVDVLSAAATNSNTNISMLGESFKYVAPVAGAMGYKVEDITVALGLMANSGIKASQAGTSLRTLLTNMANPSEKMRKAMEELNITLDDGHGNMKSFAEIMGDLRKGFGELKIPQEEFNREFKINLDNLHNGEITQEQYNKAMERLIERGYGAEGALKAQTAAQLAGKTGLSGLMAIVNASTEDYDKLTEAIENSNGTAKKMSETMIDNLNGAITIMKSALEGAAIVIGKRLTPYIRTLAEWITKLTSKFNSLDEEQQDNIVRLGLMVAAAGPVLLIGSKAINLMLKVKTGVTGVNASISLFVQALSLAKRGEMQAAESVSDLYRKTQLLKGGFASMISPVGLIVGATGLMVGGLVALEVQHRRQIESLSQLTKSEQELTDRINEQYESYQRLSGEKSKVIESADGEAQKTKNLWQELQNITDENGKIKKGYSDRASVITGELSEALGKEVSITDGIIDNYKKLSKNIDETIQKQKALAIQEALKTQYSEAVSNRVEAQKKYNDALATTEKYSAQVQKKQEELNQLNSTYKNSNEKTVESMKEYQRQQKKVSDELEIARGKYEKSKEGLNKAEEAYVGYNETIQNYEGIMSATASGEADKINEALLRMEQGFLTAETSTLGSLVRQNQNLQSQYETMKQNLADGTQGVTQEMVDNLGALLDESTVQLVEKINGQGANLNEAMAQLGFQMPESLANSLVEKEPEVITTVYSLLEKVNDGTKLKGKDIKSLFKQLGIDAPKNLQSSLKSKNADIQQQAIGLLMQLQYGETKQRPKVLQQLKDLGIKGCDSVAGGLESNKGKVEKAGGKVGKSANKEIAKEVGKEVDSPDIKSMDGKAKDVGRSAWQKLKDIFSKPITQKINVKKSGSVDGSHANGLSYVPYNGYIAELHRGERVLTAKENKAYNAGRSVGTQSTGDTFNFYNTQPTPYEYARQMKKAKRDLLYGF